MQSCQAATPRRAKPVTPLNIKLSVGRRRLLHTDGKQMSLLAAVSSPHAPLGEGPPSSRWQQQGRTGLAPYNQYQQGQFFVHYQDSWTNDKLNSIAIAVEP